MSHFIRILCLAYLMALVAPDLQAASYYVDRNNASANDANPGTASQPWKTIQKAVNVAVAGDTVYIKAGVYSEALAMVRSGTAGAPIVFTRYGSDQVVIDGTSSSAAKLIDWKAGSTGNRSYITFQGLEVRNGYGWGFWIEGDHNRIIDCVVHDNGLRGSSNASGIFAEHGKYNEITGNRVYNNKWNGINLENSEYSTIDRNVSYANGHMGVNVFSDTAAWYGMMTGNNITHNVIYGNVQSGIYTRYQQYNRIADNIIYGNTQWGIFIHYGGTGAPTVYDAHTEIYNNTVSDNAWDGIYIHSANYVTVKNNIITGNSKSGGKVQLRFEKYTGQVADYNLYDTAANVIYWNLLSITLSAFKSLGYEAHGVIGSPQFVAASSGNYDIAGSSSAVDRGDNLSAVNDDFDGTARPQGAAYDIGAHEVASIVQRPPAAPRNLRWVN